MPGEVNGRSGITLSRDYAEGSKGNSHEVVGDEHLSQEEETQTRHDDGDTEETKEHPVRGFLAAPFHIYR